MRKFRVVAALLICLLLAGCDMHVLFVVSLQPLVEEKDAVFEPALVGTWQAEEDNELIRFTPREPGGYLLEVLEYKETEEGPQETVKEKYECRAVRLGRYLFLDVVSKADPPDPYWVPMHFVVRVDLSGDEVRFEALKADWVKQQFDEKRAELAHTTVQDTWIVLTASTEELQDFYRLHSWDDEAFDTGATYRRKE